MNSSSTAVEHRSGCDEVFRHPFNMIVCGQSGCGKTQFILRLLEHRKQLFDTEFDRIIYAYGIYQPIYRDLAKQNITVVEGMPQDLPSNRDKATLLVLDDLFLETGNKKTAELFTRMRHLNMSTIFVTHNFFHDCRYMRTITRNASYLVFFRNPRDVSQITYLSRQMYPGKSLFLCDALKQATQKPFGYLLIDLKPDTSDELRVSEGIFPAEQLYFYKPA